MITRLTLAVLSVLFAAACLSMQGPKALAILSAALSALSGWLSIRNLDHEVRLTARDHIVVRGLRRLIASDRAMALFFLQLALLTQSISTLLQNG